MRRRRRRRGNARRVLDYQFFLFALIFKDVVAIRDDLLFFFDLRELAFFTVAVSFVSHRVSSRGSPVEKVARACPKV